MPEDRNLSSMEAVIDTMVEAGDNDHVCVGDVIDEIGDDAFGPLMLVPALVAVTPVSGIPGLTATCGLIIALVAVQLVFRRKTLWLPGFLRNRSIARDRLKTGREWLGGPARFVDRWTAKRLPFLVRPPCDVVPATICMCLGLMMPFLEFIPFSGSIAAGAVSLFALSLVTEDGLLAVFGSALVATAGWLIFAALA